MSKFITAHNVLYLCRPCIARCNDLLNSSVHENNYFYLPISLISFKVCTFDWFI